MRKKTDFIIHFLHRNLKIRKILNVLKLALGGKVIFVDD